MKRQLREKERLLKQKLSKGNKMKKERDIRERLMDIECNIALFDRRYGSSSEISWKLQVERYALRWVLEEYEKCPLPNSMKGGKK